MKLPDFGDKKTEEPHFLNTNEMAQCSFQPQQPLATLRSTSLEIEQDGKVQLPAATALSLKSNEMTQRSFRQREERLLSGALLKTLGEPASNIVSNRRLPYPVRIRPLRAL